VCRWKRGKVEGHVRCTAACPGNPSTNAKTSGDHIRIGSWARTKLETAAPKSNMDPLYTAATQRRHGRIRLRASRHNQSSDMQSCADRRPALSLRHHFTQTTGSSAWNWATSGAPSPALLLRRFGPRSVCRCNDMIALRVQSMCHA